MAKLTADQHREIADLREKGWSYARIARRFGVSDGAIHYHCLRLGAISPRTRASNSHHPGAVILASDGRRQRRFTPEEDAALLAAEAEGLTVLQISRRLGRPYTSTRFRLMALALRDDGYGVAEARHV